MNDMRIAIILGSTRPGRRGDQVAVWVWERAQARPKVAYEVVDLLDYPLPHLDEPLLPALGQYKKAHTKRWSEKISEYDGYIFVTPEYNHSTSAVLKNALDYLKTEWANKAAAFVSYGAMGGARAVEHLRCVASELQLAHVRTQLTFSMHTDFEDLAKFRPSQRHAATASMMFDQLEAWARALKPLRSG